MVGWVDIASPSLSLYSTVVFPAFPSPTIWMMKSQFLVLNYILLSHVPGCRLRLTYYNLGLAHPTKEAGEGLRQAREEAAHSLGGCWVIRICLSVCTPKEGRE